ncbi:MAG: diheme cytochrome c [Methylococcus sp.]|nr:diheme cytochrome c [Methylococcus sp.]
MSIPTRSFVLAGFAGILLVSSGLQASGNAAAPPDPAYVQECGSCHAAYPPRRLSGASWQAVLAGLDKHFSVDASLDPKIFTEISAYLNSQAGRQETASADGRPLLRITETRWFRHEHDEVPEAAWKRPAVKSPSNCGACHTAADQGRYSEHGVRIPQ